MIRIERDIQEPDIYAYRPKSWSGEAEVISPALREQRRAVAFYTDPANYDFDTNEKLTRSSFSFAMYNHAETKKALEELFHGKCAYCESSMMHVDPGDIEHFRPKAEVHTKDGEVLKPGYYWLGADWHNLLLSCIKCNRSNKQAINVDDGVVQKMGKANHFPLTNEGARVRLHSDNLGDEDGEVELLNPCVDHPEDHFIFEDNGEITALDERAEQSIAIYGLFRADLVKRRKEISDQLHKTLITVTETAKALELMANNQLPTDGLLIVLETNLAELDVAFNVDGEFLALKRQKLKRFIADNPVSIQKLIDKSIDLAKDYLPED